MVNQQDIKRFDIWLVRLDPTQGSEINKTRPCVIISPDEMMPLRTAIVAPMTSKGFHFPTRIPCNFQEKQGFVVLDQMRAVDKSRLVKKLSVIARTAQIEIISCWREMFAY